MKIWKMRTNKHKYGYYHGFIVVANSREEAIAFIREKYKGDLADSYKNFMCTYVGETHLYSENYVLMSEGC